MKNYCMNFVSIKNLETKAVKNIAAVKGGQNGSGTRNNASTSGQTQQTELL